MKSTANTKTNSGKKRGNPQNLKPWKPGQSGNPKGAPKRGESWSEIIAAVGDLTAEEIHKQLGNNDLGRAYRQMPTGIAMKRLVVYRAFAAVMFEPSNSLINTLIERVEGKVPQPIDMTWRAEAEREGYDPNQLFTELVAAARARIVVGEGDSGSLADRAD